VRIAKNILLYLGITLGLLQLIQIDIPAPPKSLPQDEIRAPNEIMTLLKRSCYECHSNSADIPWYGNIAPISFSVRGHIKDGRAWLNYQIWNTYTKEEQKERLEQTVHSLKTLQMPIPTYLWAHKDARLDKTQRDLMIEWANSELKTLDNK